MLKSALLLTAGIAIGAVAVIPLKADMTEQRLALNSDASNKGPGVYAVFEANVADEAAYTKALPDVQKIIKENHGGLIAGGFNKAKLITGKPTPGNRFVVVRFDSEADFAKSQTDGVKAWIEKNAPEARQVMLPGVE